MRLQDILNMARNYLEIGIVLVVIVFLIMIIGYGIVYKKYVKEKEE